VNQIIGVSGTAARSIRARFRAKVVCNTTAKPGGLSAAQQAAILGNVSVDFTVLNGEAQPFTPYKSIPLTKLRIGGKVMLEKDAVGVGSATGLQAPIVVGTNILTWDSFLPLGHVEFLNLWNKLGGLGDEQLRTCALTIKTGAEPLKGGDATVELTEVSFQLFADTQDAPEGAQSWGETVHYERLVNSDDDEVTTKDGLVFVVYDEANPLSASAFQRIRVLRNGKPITDDPCTPASVDAWFAVQPDTGTVEASITSDVVPLYRMADMDLDDVQPGPITVKMVDDVTEFALGYWYMPLPQAAQVHAALKKMLERYPAGTVLHAVSKATVLGLKVKDSLLPFLGFYVYKADHQTAKTTAGLRIEANKDPYIWVPATDRFKAGQEYLVARQLGDDGAMTRIIRRICNDIPTSVGSTKGYEGGITKPVRDVQALLEATADAILKQQQQQQQR